MFTQELIIPSLMRSGTYRPITQTLEISMIVKNVYAQRPLAFAQAALVAQAQAKAAVRAAVVRVVAVRVVAVRVARVRVVIAAAV